MKKLSIDKLVETIHTLRKENGLTQAQLADATGINRAMIGRIENKDYVPTVEQMQTLGETLGFEVVDMFVDDADRETLQHCCCRYWLCRLISRYIISAAQPCGCCGYCS